MPPRSSSRSAPASRRATCRARASARTRGGSPAACAGRGTRARRSAQTVPFPPIRPLLPLLLSPMSETRDLLEHDLQASPPDVRIGLSRAGVTGVNKAIRIRHGDAEKLIGATIDCTVD